MLLRAYGLDPASAQARNAIGLVRDHCRWEHYDVLRGLDHLRAAGAVPGERVAEAIELVESKRGADGLWPLENPYPGVVHFVMGRPSRWNTLRAIRVLRWYQAAMS